jgi:hypothetical protein
VDPVCVETSNESIHTAKNGKQWPVEEKNVGKMAYDDFEFPPRYQLLATKLLGCPP